MGEWQREKGEKGDISSKLAPPSSVFSTIR